MRYKSQHESRQSINRYMSGHKKQQSTLETVMANANGKWIDNDIWLSEIITNIKLDGDALNDIIVKMKELNQIHSTDATVKPATLITITGLDDVKSNPEIFN
eukprot:44383_1